MVIVEGVGGVLRSDFTKDQDIRYKKKIRPTDPLQNLLCNPKHIFFWPNLRNAVRSIKMSCQSLYCPFLQGVIKREFIGNLYIFDCFTLKVKKEKLQCQMKFFVPPHRGTDLFSLMKKEHKNKKHEGGYGGQAMALLVKSLRFFLLLLFYQTLFVGELEEGI